MVNPFDKSAEVIAGVIQQAFAYHDPVADIGGKAQLRQLLNDLQRQPRAIQRRGAMGFKAAEQLIFGGELMRLPRKSTCCASGQRSLPASRFTKRGLSAFAAAKRSFKRSRCCAGVSPEPE
jgi:hypothetical protein